MTLTQLAAAVAPVVLLVSLAVKAARWQTRMEQRITGIERTLARHSGDLHDIGVAVSRQRDPNTP